MNGRQGAQSDAIGCYKRRADLIGIFDELGKSV